LDKVEIKYDTDFEALQIRMNASYSEFKKKRAAEIEKLMLKHHNKFKEIDRATRDVPDNKAKSQYFY